MRNNRLAKERIIYNNYNVSERYNYAKEYLMEDMEEGEEPSENDIWEEVNFQDQITWEDEKERLIDFFNEQSNYWILVGSVGRWDGCYDGGFLFETFEEMFYKATKDCDYIKIYDENGHLYLTCSHHDGTCSYEIKAVTDNGYNYYDNWNYSGSCDKRTEREVHTQIMKRYSRLPRFAEKIFGCSKVEYEESTKKNLINKLNNQAKSFYC